MNLFDKFSKHFGSTDSAIAFLAMNGYSVHKGRYNEWVTGKRLPRLEVLNLILSTVTDVDLTPSVSTSNVSYEQVSHELIDTVPVDKLRRALPHRRFTKKYFQQARFFDAQVLRVIYRFDVWEEFVALCGNENNATYVLRRNCPHRRVTTDWVQNRINDGWQADVVNVMVRLIRRFKDAGLPFTALDLSAPPVKPVITDSMREAVRAFALKANPKCDVDSLPDEMIARLYKDMPPL